MSHPVNTKCNKMAYSQKQISLTDAPRALREHGAVIQYQALWKHVVAGDFPAERIGKHWMLHAADIPTIAKALTSKT